MTFESKVFTPSFGAPYTKCKKERTEFIDMETIGWLYFSYIITISLKNIRKIAPDQVATFSLQPAAEGLRV